MIPWADTAFHLVTTLIYAFMALVSGGAAVDCNNTAPLVWRLFWPLLFAALTAWAAARLFR